MLNWHRVWGGQSHIMTDHGVGMLPGGSTSILPGGQLSGPYRSVAPAPAGEVRRIGWRMVDGVPVLGVEETVGRRARWSGTWRPLPVADLSIGPASSAFATRDWVYYARTASPETGIYHLGVVRDDIPLPSLAHVFPLSDRLVFLSGNSLGGLYRKEARAHTGDHGWECGGHIFSQMEISVAVADKRTSMTLADGNSAPVEHLIDVRILENPYTPRIGEEGVYDDISVGISFFYDGGGYSGGVYSGRRWYFPATVNTRWTRQEVGNMNPVWDHGANIHVGALINRDAVSVSRYLLVSVGDDGIRLEADLGRTVRTTVWPWNPSTPVCGIESERLDYAGIVTETTSGWVACDAMTVRPHGDGVEGLCLAQASGRPSYDRHLVRVDLTSGEILGTVDFDPAGTWHPGSAPDGIAWHPQDPDAVYISRRDPLGGSRLGAVRVGLTDAATSVIAVPPFDDYTLQPE